MAEINTKSRLAILPPSGYVYKTKFNIDWKQTIQKGKKAHIWLSKNYLFFSADDIVLSSFPFTALPVYIQ